MTRVIAGSIRTRSFGVLFLVVAIGVGALLVTASGPDAKPEGAPPPLVGGKVAFVGSPLYVTAAAHVTGAVGTDWRTDLEVYNSGSVQATYEIALLKKNRANPNPTTAQFTLNPGMSVRYNDILLSVFGFTGSASLRITVVTGEVTVSSRTYNQVTGGTYGQFIGGEPESRAVHHGQEGRIIQLTHSVSTSTGFRTNVGFLNCTGGTIAVQIDLYLWDGTFLGSRSYSLEAYMYKQIDRIFRQVTQDDVTDGYVVIRTTTPGGKFFAYASVVDNRTGDPIYIPAVVMVGGGGPSPPTFTPTPTRQGAELDLAPYRSTGRVAPISEHRNGSSAKVAVSEPVYIAASAHVAGAVGTNWRTDLELHNPGTSQGQYEIALLLKNQANPNPQTAVYTVGPGRCVRLNDVLLSVFGFEGGASLRVRTLSGDVIVTSRTYNQTSEGTYGQFIGGAPESEAIDHGEEGVIIQLSQQQAKSTGFRANLGFVSAVGTTLVVQADMYRSDGTFLGSRTWNLQSWMHRQQDRIFQQVTGNDLADGYIIVKTLTPGGRFFAYASVVDNATGDPVYIPATVLGGGGVPPTPTPTPTPIEAPPFDPQDLGQQIFDWIGEFPGTADGRNLEQAVADFQAEGLGPLLQEVANSTPGIANATASSLNVNYGGGYVLDDGTVATGQFSVDFSNIVNTSEEVGFNVSFASVNLTINGEAPQIDQATGSATLSVGAGGHVQGGVSFNGSGQTPKSTFVNNVAGNFDVDTLLCLYWPVGGDVSFETEQGTYSFSFHPDCDGDFEYEEPPTTYDWSYSYGNPEDPHAMQHIVFTDNAEVYTEGPVTLWKPMVGAETLAETPPGVIHYHFAFDRTVRSAHLYLNMPTFHWSYSRGHNFLYGSTDGSSWLLLLEVPPPEFGSANAGVWNSDLPAWMTSGNDIWLRIELYCYGSSASQGGVWTNTAQHSRWDANSGGTVFMIEVDFEGK